MPDNSGVNRPEPPATPGENQRPFWNDPEQLKAASDRIAEGGSLEIRHERLKDLLPHEQWRLIDERYLELQQVDTPDAPA
jgi:hypothetical protein